MGNKSHVGQLSRFTLDTKRVQHFFLIQRPAEALLPTLLPTDLSLPVRYGTVSVCRAVSPGWSATDWPRAQAIIRKQRATIEKLTRENRQMKQDLNETRAVAASRSALADRVAPCSVAELRYLEGSALPGRMRRDKGAVSGVPLRRGGFVRQVREQVQCDEAPADPGEQGGRRAQAAV